MSTNPMSSLSLSVDVEMQGARLLAQSQFGVCGDAMVSLVGASAEFFVTIILSPKRRDL
jgi:hypothetical protein